MDPIGEHYATPTKRRRGPYEGYLMDPNRVNVPESTLRARTRQPGDGDAARDLEEQEIHQAILEPESDPTASGSGSVSLLEEAPTDSSFAPLNCDISDSNSSDFSDASDNSDLADHSDAPSDNSDALNNDSNIYTTTPFDDNSTNNQDHCQDDETDNMPPKSRQKFIDKHQLNNPLHKDFKCTQLEALLMILHMAYRHCNTQAFIEDQIKFVNTLFGGSNVLDVSYYIYQTLFKPSSSILRHYFCPTCEVSFKSEKDWEKGTQYVECPKCEMNVDVHSFDSGNFFVTMSIKQQIETILSKANTKLVERESRNPDVISDLCGGQLYKKCSEPNGPFHAKKFLTVTFNTDGVSIFKSTKNSLWPVQLYINELCPEQRFLTENLILGGLWFGKSAPNMALFLKPFLQELRDLSEEGVNYVKLDNSVENYHIYACACSVDAVAKCKIMCMKQFNGFFGCLYCTHPNDAVVDKEGGSSSRLLRHYDTSVSYPVRTEENVIADMCQADTKDRNNQLKSGSVHGFLGISVLLMLVAQYTKSFPAFTVFSVVWSIVIDYMHCALEGVMADLLDHFENILTNDQIEILNKRLSKISLPQGMTRRPRSLIDRVNWKAKEYRSFCYLCYHAWKIFYRRDYFLTLNFSLELVLFF